MSKALPEQSDSQGQQRLSRDALSAWEAMAYGMFIHFGMSTYDQTELSLGTAPATSFNPDALDVDQWVQVARDAGMEYAVLTAKHVSGFCLWPSRHTDYHVGRSRVKTDIVERFVTACDRHNVRPGLYYCSWDNHHRLGSVTPTFAKQCPKLWPHNAWTTQAYRDFQFKQIEELLTQYGPLVEFWLDIPTVLGSEGRSNQYAQIVGHQPDCVIVANAGLQDSSVVDLSHNWPTDVVTLERNLPLAGGYKPWHFIGKDTATEGWHYLPAEVNEPIGRQWFYEDADAPKSARELLAMRLLCEARGTNFLLNVPPDRSGRIPPRFIEALRATTQACNTIPSISGESQRQLHRD